MTLTMRDLRERYNERQVADIAARREAILKDLLGRWVSELEPALMCGPGGTILGIGMAGPDNSVPGGIILRPRPLF